jgi:hypothetical protein
LDVAAGVQEREMLKELAAATKEHEEKKKKHLRKLTQGYGSGARNSIASRGRVGVLGIRGLEPRMKFGLDSLA